MIRHIQKQIIHRIRSFRGTMELRRINTEKMMPVHAMRKTAAEIRHLLHLTMRTAATDQTTCGTFPTDRTMSKPAPMDRIIPRKIPTRRTICGTSPTGRTKRKGAPMDRKIHCTAPMDRTTPRTVPTNRAICRTVPAGTGMHRTIPVISSAQQHQGLQESQKI